MALKIPERKVAAKPVDTYTGAVSAAPILKPISPATPRRSAKEIQESVPVPATRELDGLAASLGMLVDPLTSLTKQSLELEDEFFKNEVAKQVSLNIGKKWDQFLRDNPDVPKTADPRYRTYYMKEQARYSAMSWGSEIAQLLKSGEASFEIKGQKIDVLDPKAPPGTVGEFLKERYKQAIMEYGGGDGEIIREALAPVLDKQMAQLSRIGEEMRQKKLEEARTTVISQTVHDMIQEGYANAGDSDPSKAIGQKLTLFAADKIKEHMSGNVLNKIIVKAATAIAEDHNDPSLIADILKNVHTNPENPTDKNSLWSTPNIRALADKAIDDLERDTYWDWKMQHEKEQTQKREWLDNILERGYQAMRSDSPLKELRALQAEADAAGRGSDFRMGVIKMQRAMAGASEVKQSNFRVIQRILQLKRQGNTEDAQKLLDQAGESGQIKLSDYVTHSNALYTAKAKRTKASSFEPYVEFESALKKRMENELLAHHGDGVAMDVWKSTGVVVIKRPQYQDMFDEAVYRYGMIMDSFFEDYEKENNGSPPSDTEVRQAAWDAKEATYKWFDDQIKGQIAMDETRRKELETRRSQLLAMKQQERAHEIMLKKEAIIQEDITKMHDQIEYMQKVDANLGVSDNPAIAVLERDIKQREEQLKELRAQIDISAQAMGRTEPTKLTDGQQGLPNGDIEITAQNLPTLEVDEFLKYSKIIDKTARHSYMLDEFVVPSMSFSPIDALRFAETYGIKEKLEEALKNKYPGETIIIPDSLISKYVQKMQKQWRTAIAND
jgi:phosphopantetheinyl transferase (holo-ACP synthase)